MNQSPVILAVDDDFNNLQVIEQILLHSDLGCRLIKAIDAAQACQIAYEHKPALILMDWEMPYMDGLEAVKLLKKYPETADIPIIMLTGRSATSDLKEAFAAGASDYISKPFKIDELLARVRSALHLYLSMQEIKRQNEAIQQQNMVIRKQNEELQSLNQLKDQLFSIISHDLKSPVHSLTTLLDTLNQHKDLLSAQETAEYFSLARQSLQNVSNLLESLLLWSGQRMKGVFQTAHPFLFSVLVDEVLGLFQTAIQHKQLRMVVETDPEILLRADRNTIGLVLRNLVDNAIKFSYPQGTVLIRAGMENGKLVIAVTDHGVGLSKEALRFFQEHRAMNTTPGTYQEKGTGLGLLLCADLLKDCGADLEVKSKTGEGTTFSFSFPGSMLENGWQKVVSGPIQH